MGCTPNSSSRSGGERFEWTTRRASSVLRSGRGNGTIGIVLWVVRFGLSAAWCHEAELECHRTRTVMFLKDQRLDGLNVTEGGSPEHFGESPKIWRNHAWFEQVPGFSHGIPGSSNCAEVLPCGRLQTDNKANILHSWKFEVRVWVCLGSGPPWHPPQAPSQELVSS